MRAARVLYHLVRADFLERVRRTSFLLTLGFAVYLGYLAFSGTIVMSLGDYRSVYNSAWVGALMGLVAACFLTLVGFYVVKNTILRDEQTRVGQILATTPISKTFYTLGKAVSNFAVLASMLVVIALASIVIQLVRAEDTQIQLWTLLSPLLLLAVPALALTASLAIFFETVPGLRGGAGNVIYFFLWTALLSGFGQIGTLEKGVAPPTAVQYFADYSGVVSLMIGMQRQVRDIDPHYNNAASLNIGHEPPAKRFVLKERNWTAPLVISRLFWIVVALGFTLLSAAFFHRFDPARETSRTRAGPARVAKEELNLVVSANEPWQLTPLERTRHNPAFLRLVASELHLMFQGQKWWWYLGAAGLLVGQLVSPHDVGEGFLVAAWLWPILLWSQMGSRESRYATSALLFSAPRVLRRQLPALWCAGIVVAMATGAGTGIRLVLAGNVYALLVWITAALFIPSLALALGVWSQGSKTFEAVYAVWWYAGPLHHTPRLDFMGTTLQSADATIYLAFSAVLIAAAFLGRRRSLGYA